MATAKQGDTVKVHYTGKLEDGTVFDSSEGREPLEFTLGEGMLIPGFEQIVEGMSPGETRTGQISAEQAYGEHDDQMVLEVARESMPEDIEPEVGQELEIQHEGGQSFPVVITEVTDEVVTLDGNHPLAGKDLTFQIELLEIIA